jgi:hypothetical protein
MREPTLGKTRKAVSDMDTTPVLARTDDPVDRVIENIQQLAAVRPALLRLLEWQIDQELEQTQRARPSARSFLILIPDGDDLPITTEP